MLTVDIDKYGLAKVTIPLPEPVLRGLLAELERGERVRDIGTVWDLDAGVWISIEGHDSVDVGVGPDGLTLRRWLSSPSAEDHTLPPALTLDDELAIIRAARVALGPHIEELRGRVG